jgi:hypothetical protein
MAILKLKFASLPALPFDGKRLIQSGCQALRIGRMQQVCPDPMLESSKEKLR